MLKNADGTPYEVLSKPNPLVLDQIWHDVVIHNNNKYKTISPIPRQKPQPEIPTPSPVIEEKPPVIEEKIEEVVIEEIPKVEEKKPIKIIEEKKPVEKKKIDVDDTWF